ncbi:MAG: hypothetical protein U0M06_11045 [Clostridia bacterium]|nr:hypothetical protein [Clostridia bacterium]
MENKYDVCSGAGKIAKVECGLGNENPDCGNFVNHETAVKIAYSGVGYSKEVCPDCINKTH